MSISMYLLRRGLQILAVFYSANEAWDKRLYVVLVCNLLPIPKASVEYVVS